MQCVKSLFGDIAIEDILMRAGMFWNPSPFKRRGKLSRQGRFARAFHAGDDNSAKGILGHALVGGVSHKTGLELTVAGL